MNDLEQAFRDALRRADTTEIPVPPIDPAEFTGGRNSRMPWRTILAAAAAVVVVAGAGTVWVLAGRGLPAGPIAPAPEPVGATVEVQIFSGRENPVVELSGPVTDELYALLDDDAGAAEHVDPHQAVLGFQGFAVTPVDEDRPILWVLPTQIRFGPVHDYKGFDDPDQVFFRLILDAIRPSLPDDVLKAINEATKAPDDSTPPTEDPEQPNNRTWETVTWVLLEDATPESTDLIIAATRRGCPAGATSTIHPVVLEYGEDQIVIRADVAAWNDDPADCNGTEEPMASVHLDEPIGQRQLVDAACLSGEAQGTTYCEGGAVRWTP